MVEDTLAGALRQSEQWSLDILAALVACPSVTGRPSAINDLVQPVLDELGFEVEAVPVSVAALVGHPEYSPPSDATGEQPPALVATRHDGPARALMLFAHTDTEPVHAGWTGDPYELRLTGDRATGLGVADDKAGVVAILAAVRAVQASGVAMTWRPTVVLGSGKQGGALGTLPGTLVAEGIAGAVYSHPAESGRGLADLKVASRGVIEFEITVEGEVPRPAEERTPISADPRTGRNAADRAARLARIVTEHDDGVVRTVTALHAETGPFTVPDRARLIVAHWFAEGDSDIVSEELTRLLAAAARDDWDRAHPPRIRPVGMRANPASCAGSPFAEWAAEALTAVTGSTVEEYDWHSASDIRFPMRCHGVPAVGFGATAGQFYGPDEWVDLATLHDSTAVLARMLTQ